MEKKQNKAMGNNIWAIVGVVLTILTMFGGVSMFLSNFNAKIVSLEVQNKETQSDLTTLSIALADRDVKISKLVIDVTEVKANEKHQLERLTSIDHQLIQTDRKYMGFMEQLSKMNANLSSLGENTKYIKSKIDLQDKIILGAILKDK